MSGYLLDSNVISEALKKKPDRRVLAWLEVVDPQSLHLSVITLGEIRQGVEMRTRDKRRATLENWLTSELPDEYAGRILPFDSDVADRWGRIVAQARKSGVTLAAIDSMIAATALHYNLTVATRNTRHFSPCGVAVLDPWSDDDSEEPGQS